MNLSVKIRGLNKSFRGKKVLNDLNLDIEENKIYGLAGKNGAGKSTLLKILSCYYIKDSGSIEVFGEEPFENEKILSKMCFTAGKREFLPYLKVKDVFNIVSKFYENWDKEFKNKLVDLFELDINKEFAELSDGMRACINAIVGLASRAPLTMYDEPYSGMDPAVRDVFYKMLLEDYEKYPRTIVFSTHYLDEVSRLFENLIIMDKGKVLLNEEIDSIRENSFYVKGDKEKIREVEEQLNVLSKESLGNIEVLSVFQDLNKNIREKLLNTGLLIESMPIQKLFISLTTNANSSNCINKNKENR